MVILFIIIGISALIFVHELGHFLAAKLSGIPVEEFGIGYPPRIISKKIGKTRYSINLLPFGGFVKIYGEQQIEKEQKELDETMAFYNQPAWRRAGVLTAGVAMNFVLGWLIFFSLFLLGTATNIAITQVVPESPAARVGLRAGDELVGFQKLEEFIGFVNANKGKEIALNIKREGKESIVNVVPRVEVPAGEGALGVGVSQLGFPKLSFFASISEGFKTSIAIAGAVFKGIANLFVGLFTGEPVWKGVVGPVGIFQIATQAAKTGLIYFFQLLAFITINLAVLNILPFPALDGGRLLFVAIEKIKGSRISIKAEAVSNAIGFSLLIFLMIVITIRDITKLF